MGDAKRTVGGRTPLILASASAVRRQLLDNAGLSFQVIAADLDEPALRHALATRGVTHPAEVAGDLARAKAEHVAAAHPGCVVIGADQVAELAGSILTKAPDLPAARKTLQALSGKTHALHSGFALAQAGQPSWSAVESAHVTMRSLSEADLDWYLGTHDPGLTGSVGTYRLEGPGVRLMERIDGDYFTILGLPLLPLLAELRQRGVIA
jgi:septum formation protein